MAQLSRELRAKGFDVVDLSLGEPDFNTPDHIKQAAKAALDENQTHYTPVAGLLTLREAICRKFQRDNDLHYQPDQIVVSNGAKQSITNLVMSLVNPGDEVIVPSPFWVSYAAMVQLTGAELVLIPSTIETDYKITPSLLDVAITPRTRLFIFSSPCNPTGAVYSYEELRALAEVFAKHPQVIVVSDEIYEYINFVGKHNSIAHFDGMMERTVTVNGMSKGYAMTGWRIGYIGAPTWIARACTKMQGQWTSGANSIAQHASIAALNGELKPSLDMQRVFNERRIMVREFLRTIPGLRVNNPGGAFYFFPEVSAFIGKRFEDVVINSSNDLVMYLLHHAQVAVVDGAPFGGEHCLRISYANATDKIKTGLERIKTALGKLQ
jgi:aspartate aminotransferase